MNQPPQRTPHAAAPAPTDGAKPGAILVLIAASALGLASMVGGTYAIYAGTIADSAWAVLGGHVSVSSVGVALVAVGFVAEVAVFREFLQYLERLARLKE